MGKAALADPENSTLELTRGRRHAREREARFPSLHFGNPGVELAIVFRPGYMCWNPLVPSGGFRMMGIDSRSIWKCAVSPGASIPGRAFGLPPGGAVRFALEDATVRSMKESD